MDEKKTQKQAVLGTLVNEDASGVIAYSDQIYDKKKAKSVEERITDAEDLQASDNASRISDLDKVNEHLDNLDTKDANLQESIENITKTGEASAAANVTYDHTSSNTTTENQLDASNVQQAIDEVYKKSNYNDGDEVVDFNTVHLVEDNSEFIAAWVDADGRLLVGIKSDTGSPYYGVGVPEQVKDYIDGQINKILGTDDVTSTIDSLKELEAFLKDFTNSDTLKQLLDLKADVDDVKETTDDIYKKSNPNDEDGNVVDTNSVISVEDNPEYIHALTDSENKMLESTDVEGKKTFYGDVEVKGEFKNEDFKENITEIKNTLDNKVDKEESKSLINEDIANANSVVEDVEYLSLDIDGSQHILRGIKKDGLNYLPKAKIDDLFIGDAYDTVQGLIKSAIESLNNSLQSFITSNYIEKSKFDIEIFNPDDIYVLENTTLQIFKNSLGNIVNAENYCLKLAKPTNIESGNTKYGANYNFCYEYTATSELLTFGFTPGLLCGITNTLYLGNPLTIHTIAKASSPDTIKNVVVIGDSYTDGQKYTAELRRLLTGVTSYGSDSADSSIAADSLTNINFIGTQDTEEGHTPNEGWGGEHYKFFAGYGGRSHTEDSPFKNPDTGDIDIDYYMSTGNVKGSLQDVSEGDLIDYAIIYLGNNGNYDEQYVTIIWDALLKHNPNIKVIICGATIPNPYGNPAALSYTQTYYEIVKEAITCNKFLKGMTEKETYKGNFLYVDVNMSFDALHNGQYDSVDANLRNSSEKVRRATDGGHPANSGYYQIADALRGPFHYWFLSNN